MPLVGRLSDGCGRKRFIVTGLFVYSLVSLGLLLAISPVVLTIVRLGQGCAAAMIIPLAQAYMGEIAPPSKEGKYMGLFSVALFTGFGLGPLLGGILKDLYGMKHCHLYPLYVDLSRGACCLSFYCRISSIGEKIFIAG